MSLSLQYFQQERHSGSTINSNSVKLSMESCAALSSWLFLPRFIFFWCWATGVLLDERFVVSLRADRFRLFGCCWINVFLIRIFCCCRRSCGICVNVDDSGSMWLKRGDGSDGGGGRGLWNKNGCGGCIADWRDDGGRKDHWYNGGGGWLKAGGSDGGGGKDHWCGNCSGGRERFGLLLCPPPFIFGKPNPYW